MIGGGVLIPGPAQRPAPVPVRLRCPAMSELPGPADKRNRMRWRPGQRGRYEGWYLAFNDPAATRGWWIRSSLRAPTDPGESPYCQLWFMRTDREARPRHRALRETFPIQDLRATS